MNETKSKIMKMRKNGEDNRVNISLNDRRMEEVETYRYLEVVISSDGGMLEEVNHQITEAKKARGALKDMEKEAYISRGKSRNV